MLNLFIAWYEWWTADAVYWPESEISIRAGDPVTMSVKALSSTSGNATVTNHNTGQTVLYHFVDRNPRSAVATLSGLLRITR